MKHQTLTEKQRLIELLLFCVFTAFLLTGCASKPAEDPAPTATPAPVLTADPQASGEIRELEERLLAGAANALRLETQAVAENNAIASARVPSQILHQFLDALADEGEWTHEAGKYTRTASSGGDYVYEKPYSELITGSSTDVYTIEDDEGWVEEVVDNTRFDPFTWVMSGEGGGEFVYMSVYELQEDAGSGQIETVSRLNGSISGWSYDEFRVADGRYRFIDLQLSPDEEGLIQTPYRWILCIGDIGQDSARIEEIGLTTQALELPLSGLDLMRSGEELISEAERLGDRISLLTLNKGSIAYSEK